MSLNIKNSQTHALIRELARLKGISMTAAVTEAVQRELNREKASEDREGIQSAARRYERLKGHVKEYSRRVANPVHSWQIDSFLYDENGLPK
ncbi:MAG: type II toxin-antitoxin system VapB family antitoxin [Terracidiphilus sp.]